ncbi:MAG: hypothetical protein D6718_05005 [Acidobacteria bacterium]|nr:MAG: hypothetical protein D6718_05005 [Acidobacteriota bacterium]
MTTAMRKNSERPPLSKSEWALMNLCWKRGRATARQIYEDSLARRRRDYRTVKTMLDRIAAKGYLKVEKLGPLCLYTPVVSRREATSRAIREFIDVVLDRTLAPLFLHLAEEEDLDEEELAALRRLIEKEERS